MFADTTQKARAVRKAEGRREKAVESMRCFITMLGHQINFVVSSPEATLPDTALFRSTIFTIWRAAI